MQVPSPIAATAVTFIAACCLLDLRARRIPNLLSGSFMLGGATLNGVLLGVPGVVSSLVGLATMVGVLLLPFALGGIGGGDVKMMGAIGALLGPGLALGALGLGVIFGGATMIVHLARMGRLRETVQRMWSMAKTAVFTGSLSPLKVSASDQAAVALPYSVPLGLGTIAALALAGAFGWPS